MVTLPTPRLSRRRFGALLMAGALTAGALMASGWSPAHAADKTVLTTRIGSDIANLDPARIFQIENQTIATQIYDGLVKYDEATNAIVPDLAESWTVSEDGKTYTFKLHEGVTWHKGYGPFTSEDVKYSFERVLDPATGSNYKGQFAAIETVAAPAPDTVVITLKQPNSGFLHKVTAFNQGWIVSKKAMEELGKDKYQTNPIGTGPFVFESWTPGREVRLSANPAYFAGAPQVDELLFRLIKDETAAAVALENGEIDIFFGLQQPAVIDRLKKSDAVTVHDRDANHTLNLVLNMQNKPLDDLRVRQAVIYALNRKGLIDGFFKGTKSPANSILTPSFVEFTDDVPSYPYDPEKAKALLAEAGATGAEIEIVAPTFNPYDKIAVAIAADLEAVGFKPKITVVERGAYLQARNKGEIDTVITGIVGAPDPDSPIISMLSKSAFPPGLNTAHYEGIEDLIVAAGQAKTPQERKDVYGEIQKKVATDIPVVPLYTDHLFIATNNKVKGFVQNSLFTMNAYPVSIEE